MKIKILFAIPNFITAGSGREMFNIIERLDKNVFEPYIVVEKEGGALFAEAVSKGYTVLVQRFSAENEKGIWRKFQKAKELAAFFKPYKFDIWQSFGWSSDFTESMVAYFSGAKYVYVKKSMNWDRLAWKVKSFLSKRIVARNTTLVSTCLAPPYLKRKTVFITGGVDTAKFSPINNVTIREEYNIPANMFLISCIAQLIPVKDQKTLLKAAAKLDDTYIILAGAQRHEAYLDELKQLTEQSNITHRVLFAGSVANVNELLNASDCFVLPTSRLGGHEEGCPVALLEAMAAGTPCIASNVGGSRDLVKHEETGLLFVPEDVEGLETCITRYMNDKKLKSAMPVNALKMIAESHTLEIEAAAFSEMYKNMLS